MEDKIQLAHGSGGKLSHELVRRLFVSTLDNPLLHRLDDSAVLDMQGRIAFTTDSYVVTPLFFPGGDIGRLAVCGTVNDLAMVGALPRHLSLSFIIEEGFPVADLERIVRSVGEAAEEAGVTVVTGDTKVVNRGCADRLFINTSGVGLVPLGVEISGNRCRVGDKILLSGTMGDHGITLLGEREGLRFESPLRSDCAPLNALVAGMLDAGGEVHALRDPTRGGVATSLNELAAASHAGIRVEEQSIPIHPAVEAACELMGFDPLYIANEGKLVAVVAPDHADDILRGMLGHRYGKEARIIGEVVAEHPGRVVMTTRLGTSRIVDMLTGELLPRIC